MINLNNNLVALANKAGFHTYWISNQHLKGIYDSPVGIMGKKAGFAHFVAPNRSDKGGPDEMLLPLLSQWLGIDDKKLDKSCDWLKDTECAGQDKVVNFKNELKNFSELPDDDLVLPATK